MSTFAGAIPAWIRSLRLPAFLRRRQPVDIAGRLYLAVVGQARQPGLYTGLEVPDTLDGRFELLTLHTWLVLRRLGQEGEEGRALGQAVFDLLFDDMDRSLREMGVGDLGVGKRVKAMAQAFYGRVTAYDQALAGAEADLADALRRNLYGTAEPAGTALKGMAAYVRRQMAALQAQPRASMLDGIPGFLPVGEADHAGVDADVKRR